MGFDGSQSWRSNAAMLLGMCIVRDAKGHQTKSRILQVITDTDRRGAQVFATDLHVALERAGQRVRTVALAPGSAGGLEVATLGRRRLGIDTLRALRREMKSADVVVAHGSSTLPACALAGFATGVPFVYRQVSDSLFWAPGGLRQLRVRLGLTRAALVVALWSGSAQTLHANFGVNPERIRIIPNAVAPDRFPPVDPEAVGSYRRSFGLDPTRPTAVYLGALVPEKEVAVAIDAIGRLADVQLLIAGEGPERHELEEQAAREAPGRVVFCGSLADPMVALRAADLLVLPSWSESMPAVLIEAGLAQLPVVASPVQGIPEIVVDCVTGHLVATRSSAALADAIRRITSNLDHARQLGKNARQHCLDRFAIDVAAAQWDGVLADVVANSGAA